MFSADHTLEKYINKLLVGLNLTPEVQKNLVWQSANLTGQAKF